jgi:hypothetical protein
MAGKPPQKDIFCIVSLLEKSQISLAKRNDAKKTGRKQPLATLMRSTYVVFQPNIKI